MRSVPERIAFQLQRLANEVAADLTPAVARVIVEKTTPESTSTNVEVAVEVARKIAKRRRSALRPSDQRSLLNPHEAANRLGVSVDTLDGIGGARWHLWRL